MKEDSPHWKEVRDQQTTLMDALNVKIFAPISINSNISGIIGLGPEYTGSKYSYDDFDLLSAFGSQTAATLLAINMSEKLAKSREQQAWQRLSAFVLHDIKNAATMLSLLQENAPEHIHEKEFQDDMLELVDDTLKRMNRVEKRLGALKEDHMPDIKSTPLKPLLIQCVQRMEKRLPDIQFRLECSKKTSALCDSAQLQSIMENLLLNGSQAQDNKGLVEIEVQVGNTPDTIIISIIDDGPGIEEQLLPDSLFEPFKTTKEGGSGIGLWQVKKLVTSMRGTIKAGNSSDKGAQFTILLPQTRSVE